MYFCQKVLFFCLISTHIPLDASVFSNQTYGRPGLLTKHADGSTRPQCNLKRKEFYWLKRCHFSPGQGENLTTRLSSIVSQPFKFVVDGVDIVDIVVVFIVFVVVVDPRNLPLKFS